VSKIGQPCSSGGIIRQFFQGKSLLLRYWNRSKMSMESVHKVNCTFVKTGAFIHIKWLGRALHDGVNWLMPIVSDLATVLMLDGNSACLIDIGIEVVKGLLFHALCSEAVCLINVITKNPLSAPIFPWMDCDRFGGRNPISILEFFAQMGVLKFNHWLESQDFHYDNSCGQ